ncbi:hypothetical protein Q1695_016312 [Nippostrongylus brasiliensis]|nr:hypothetical protein Q1695_016312 [Nippostrongylus brasiliensis]
MNKLQVFHNIFTVLAITATVSPSATSGPVCVLISPTTTTPSPTKPAPPRIPHAEQGKCGVQPPWIDKLFARHHQDTGLRMNCKFVQEALWAGEFYMRNWWHYIKREFWCQIEYYESTFRWFNEGRIDYYLTHHFKEKIKRMAETYPGTEYGCTTMYRLGYFFNFRNFALCIYSRRPDGNGTVAPCPDGTWNSVVSHYERVKQFNRADGRSDGLQRYCESVVDKGLLFQCSQENFETGLKSVGVIDITFKARVVQW